ncbi:MAG: transglutaminase domain-containing protein [Phycisphaerae bacterium]|nr:transglutaminase domain-containing protein [Phycisphaerae bacterium]
MRETKRITWTLAAAMGTVILVGHLVGEAAEKIMESGGTVKIRTSKYSDEHADDDGKRYPEVGEEITRFTWAKKELLIEKGPLAEAELRFNIYEYEGNTSPLFVEINGKVSKVTAGKTPGKFKWLTVKVPASALRVGRNDIIFKSDSTTFNSWVLGIATRCHYNRSAKGYYQGTIWNYHQLGYNFSVNGEYMVRLALKRPHRKYARKASTVKPLPNTPPNAPTGPGCSIKLIEEIEKLKITFAHQSKVPFSLTFSSSSDFYSATCDEEIDIRTRPNEVVLTKWVNIFDETGNTSLIEPTNKSLPVLPAAVNDRVWIKKELLVEDPDVFSAQLVFLAHGTHLFSISGKPIVPSDQHPPLYIDINGHSITFPAQKSWRGRGLDWFTTNIPAQYLRQGSNEIVFRSDKGSTWRIGLENSIVPNRSAQSNDGGKTWNYDAMGIRGDHNGEFLIRLRLKRYSPAGSITSPVIDLAESASSEKIKRQIIVKKLLLQWKADTPKGAAVVIRTRSGLTRLYNPATWTEWSQPYKPGEQFKSPKLRYIQWKATLVTRDPKQTPALKSVKISGSVISRPSPDEKRIKISEYQNETIVQSSWPFTYQRWDEPKLKVLREENNLDEVVKGAKTEFEKYLRLCSWSRKQLEPRQSGPGSYIDEALAILDWTGKPTGHCGKRTVMFCHHYAHLFIQSCLAIGLQARPVLLSSIPGTGHCVTEIWSNDHKKWIYMDPRNDYHAGKDGRLLNILEMHKASLNDQLARSIEIIPGKASRMKKPTKGLSASASPFKRFHAASIWLRNDQASWNSHNPIWDGCHSFRWNGRLWWRDRKVRFLPEFTKYTDRDADFYWTLNQTAIDLQYGDKPGNLWINLETVTPNFDTFEVKLDNKSWKPSHPAFTWKLRKGQNTIQARTKNKFGNTGIVSQVVLIYGK